MSQVHPSFALLAENFDFANLANALESCAISGMRMKVEQIDGVTWINDAYNANPDSVREAILWLAEFADPQKLRIALGDMLELGVNSVEHHSKILEFTLKTLPGAKIFAIGKLMTLATKSNSSFSSAISSFQNANTAKPALSANLACGDLVFLKGSRGMKMERLI
jgi:UDP-N-acetylmuramoyl-tripeptide--D-alanyl-D-alanine ligase